MRRKASMEERGNKLWHGSRFVLPEHREAMRVRERQQQTLVRPALDADKLEEMSWVLAEAIQEELRVTVTLYRSFGSEKVTFIPKQIDPVGKVLKGTADDGETPIRVQMAEILDIVLER